MIGKLLVFAIWIYQATLGPLFGNCCRYQPSCSNYCIAAIRRHGAGVGLLLGIWRLLRCNPFVPGGVDPVPEPDELRARVRTGVNRWMGRWRRVVGRATLRKSTCHIKSTPAI